MNENLDISIYQTVDMYYKRLALKYVYHISASWDIHPYPANIEFNGIGELIFRQDGDQSHEIVCRPSDGSVMVMRVGKRNTGVQIAGTDRLALQKILEKVKKLVPATTEPEKDAVKVKFWYLTNQGPGSLTRTITVPDWPEISNNYERETQKNIAHLFDQFKPSLGGQLILWQGNPGTGKTYALRSLCDAWREWCSVEYIVDPDAFFGGSSSYLINLLADSNDSYDDEEDEVSLNSNDSKKEWKLFILEDTGELLSQDAKEKTGQGLARLLNVVDGFIGQGLKILVLITSNEELGRLHPAVSRPGRCAAIVEFKNLDPDHAREWANNKGITLPQDKPYSLAELYALSNNFENKSEQKLPALIGFRLPT